MTEHFADVPHEHDVDTHTPVTVSTDPRIDPADDVVDAERDDLRGAPATEQDELDELDEGYREVD